MAERKVFENFSLPLTQREGGGGDNESAKTAKTSGVFTVLADSLHQRCWMERKEVESILALWPIMFSSIGDI